MARKSLNTKGFGLIGILLIVTAVVVVGGAGGYLYHVNHKKTPAMSSSQADTETSTKANSSSSSSKVAAPIDPYAGWKTYTPAGTSITFKYPSTWMLKDTPQCDGAHAYTLNAPTDEVAALSQGLTAYDVDVMAGAEASGTANCAPSVASRQGMAVGADSNSRAISTGALQGKYVLVNGDSTGTNGLNVFDSSYNPGQKVNESGLLTVEGTSFQITATFSNGQDTGEASTGDFLNSQLYKDTMYVLDSFSASR